MPSIKCEASLNGIDITALRRVGPTPDHDTPDRTSGMPVIYAFLWLIVVAMVWAVTRPIGNFPHRTLAFSPGVIAVIVRGDKPGWQLDIVGPHLIIHSLPGAQGGILRPGTCAAEHWWLLDEPDENNWRIGRHLSRLQLATLIQSEASSAPPTASPTRPTSKPDPEDTP